MNLRKKISIFTMLFALAMIFVIPINAKAAAVGQTLTNPEPGWQRIDDSDPLFKYLGGSWKFNDTSVSGRWNNAVSGTNSIGDKVVFKFYGTKIRILSENLSGHSSNIAITIDGCTPEIVSIATSRNRLCQYLCYENSTLDLGIHTVSITNNGGNGNWLVFDAIDIDETGYLIPYYQPTNLIAKAVDASVELQWEPIPGVTKYIVRYGTTSGNLTESQTVTGSAITIKQLNDGTPLKNGTTYYFTVSAIVNGVENKPSGEVPATPTPAITGNNAILELTMTNGVIKEYDLTAVELNDFLTWYDNKSNGTGRAYFVFTKKHSIKPFLNRKEYIAYNKISSFEVNEYAD